MKRFVLIAAIAAVSLAAFAQPVGPGPGMGAGMGRGMGPRFDAQNTPGWTMMTPDERRAHREKMLSMKDEASCQAYMEEHHKEMEARAKEKGKTLPQGPGRACDFLKKKS